MSCYFQLVTYISKNKVGIIIIVSSMFRYHFFNTAHWFCIDKFKFIQQAIGDKKCLFMSYSIQGS